MDNTHLSTQELERILVFLNKNAENNEDTEYDTRDEDVVSDIQKLVEEKRKTSIIEDFEIPYIHPMITIQKWNEELRYMVVEALAEKTR